MQWTNARGDRGKKCLVKVDRGKASHGDIERIIWKINVRNNETEGQRLVGMEKLDTNESRTTVLS